jgi:signal transduction histidine kinase
VSRIPQRLRERRFWHIQALIVLATAPHYVIESLGYTNPFETLHGLTITFYILPLLYAALNYGWEGAILTALWGAALTSPSIWIWHRSGFHWFTELGQLAVTMPVGVLVAWRVDLEAQQRRRAETISARLALLNEIGERLSHTLEVEQQLPGVLRRLLTGLSLQSVWLCLEAESEDAPAVLLAEGVPLPDARARTLHARVASAPEDVAAHGQTAVIPLVGEGSLLGSLGAMVAPGETISDEQIDLLTTIAHEIRVAVESARLYREHQDSLQSYVRQVTQAQEEERLRIARELHDETAQELVHLVRKLEQLGESAGQTLATPIQELLAMTRDTLRSVRRFSHDLRPPVLDDLGLVAAIEMVVEDATSRLSDGAQLETIGEPHRVDRAVELALFRIAQEALRNVEKHAHATSATVELQFEDHQIRLSVSDNGRGFSPPRNLSQLARLGSLGLLGMKERADLVGGSFEVRSSPGHGSKVAVSVAAD